MDFVITVKYKDRVKVLPYEHQNVHEIKKLVGPSVLHNTDKDGNRRPVREGTVKPYINGHPAEDGDVVGLGETLEFAEQPPNPPKDKD